MARRNCGREDRMRIGRLRSGARRTVSLAMLALLAGAAPAIAQGFTSNFVNPYESEGGYAKSLDFGDLYQATAIVTGTDMRQRPWGLAQCLREVLVKVSGEPRLKDDPRVIELAAHADRLVGSFDYVDVMGGLPKKDDTGRYDLPLELPLRF